MQAARRRYHFVVPRLPSHARACTRVLSRSQAHAHSHTVIRSPLPPPAASLQPSNSHRLRVSASTDDAWMESVLPTIGIDFKIKARRAHRDPHARMAAHACMRVRACVCAFA
eukprot:5152965-Pleurochrysis_carterae.AAC.3